MVRQFSRILVVALVACCSGKGPPAGEPPRVSRELPVAAAAQVTPPASATPPADPREAALAQTVLQLLEKEHLLHKHIDDDVSRAAFATYIDHLDGSKMFLLRSDRDALA